MPQIPDEQFGLLMERLQGQENRLAAAGPGEKPEIIMVMFRLVDDYISLLEAEVRSLAGYSVQVKSASETVGAPGDRHLAIQSKYHRTLTEQARGRQITRQFYGVEMLKSQGFILPWPTELLRDCTDILFNDKREHPDDSGLSFGLPAFQNAMQMRPRAETLTSELFLMALFKLSHDINTWSLQIYGGKLPKPGSADYWRRMTFFAYENTPLHNQLVHLAEGKKASKMPTSNQLEPIDAAPAGKGTPFDPETVAAEYARVLAQAGLKRTLHMVEKPAWNFMFLTFPRYYRQEAYLQSAKSERRALYRFSPLERTVATAVRHIAVGIDSGLDLSSPQAKAFAERFCRMLPRRMVPSQLWKDVLASVYEFLLPHDEVRRVFALELLGLMRHPEGLGTFGNQIDEMFPVRDVVAQRIENWIAREVSYGTRPSFEMIRQEYVRLQNQLGFSDEAIKLTQGPAGEPVLRGYTAVDYDNDRRAENLVFSIENSLKTKGLIGWFKHISKLWAQTATELHITKGELENLSDHNFTRMVAGMGLVNTLFTRPTRAIKTGRGASVSRTRLLMPLSEQREHEVETERELLEHEQERRSRSLRFSPNKASRNPYRLRFEDEDGKVRVVDFRTHFTMANGRVQLTVMETCWILKLHNMGDVSDIQDLELGNRLMTRTTFSIIAGMASFNAGDPSFHIRQGEINIQQVMMNAELDLYQEALKSQPMDEYQRLLALNSYLDELKKKYDTAEIAQNQSVPESDDEKTAPATPELQQLITEIATSTGDESFSQLVDRALKQIDLLIGTPAFNRQGRLLVDTIDRRIAMQQREMQNPLPQTAYTREIIEMAAAGSEVQAVPQPGEDLSAEALKRRQKAEWYAWLWNRYMEDEEEVRVKPYPEPQVDPALKQWFDQQEGNR